MAVYKRGNVCYLCRWIVATTATLCIAQQTVTETRIAPLSKGVVLAIFIDLHGGLPIIKGRTNLPDGTEIMAGITCGRPCRAFVEGHRYMGQVKTIVGNQRFLAGPFSLNGIPLPAGNYVADAVMPYSSLQSAEVRAVIGDLGEKLSGTLVKREPKSGFPLAATISVNKTFKLGQGN